MLFFRFFSAANYTKDYESAEKNVYKTNNNTCTNNNYTYEIEVTKQLPTFNSSVPYASSNERRASPKANPPSPVYRSIARPVAYNSNAPCNYYYATPAQLTPSYYAPQSTTTTYYPYTVNYQQVPAVPTPAKPVPTAPIYTSQQSSAAPTQRPKTSPVYHVAPNAGSSIARQVLTDHAPGFKQYSTKQSPTPPQVTNKAPVYSNHKPQVSMATPNYGSYNYNSTINYKPPVYAAQPARIQPYCPPSWPTTWPVHQANYGLNSYSPQQAWPSPNYSINCAPYMNTGFNSGLGWNTHSLLRPPKPKKNGAGRGLCGRFKTWRACRRFRKESHLFNNAGVYGQCC